MPLTLKLLEELKEIEKKATPGPWEMYNEDIVTSDDRSSYVIERARAEYATYPPNQDQDMLFCCLARNNLSSLLAAATWALENGYKEE